MRLNLPMTGLPELDQVAEVLESGYLTQGPKAAEFERLVRSHVGVKHSFATSSCTTALHLSLVAWGIGPGDEVIVPDFTFPATANVVLQLGARPVLVDIDPTSFNATAASIEAGMTSRTKAIMVVHAFGQCADMGPILEMARTAGLPVLEDAACALGGSYGGRPAGSLGTVGCFSFHPRKIITTGEGGMITTDDDELAERITVLRSHGAVPDELYLRFEEAGFNYRLSDINAAIGIAQMARLSELIAGRRSLASVYTELLVAIDGVQPPIQTDGVRHTYQSYVVTLDERWDRDEVIRRMRSAGIETTLGTYALHGQPYYARSFGHRLGDLPGSASAYRHSLTLPLYPQLPVDEVERVVSTLSDVLAGM